MKEKFFRRFSGLILVFVFWGDSVLNAQNLPTAVSDLFSGSANCALCHSAGNGAFMTSTGTDISPSALWQSTMMANSAKDPLWKAKVTAEVAEHPALRTVIENKCTTCHMPMGKTEAAYHGMDDFSFDTGSKDPLSMDGVSCTLCHQIQPHNLGTAESFSGGYQITDAHDIFGPYPSPTGTPMFNETGYMPRYSGHVHHSELCATCHTLFTPYVDNAGQVAGYFPEQTPYLEWQNSIYPGQSTECQTCHMPATEEAMKISNRPPWISNQRSPIWGHDFVGGNIFIEAILKANAAEIGVTAAIDHFDVTIAKTTELLRERTIGLSATAIIVGDTMAVDVFVENLSGHKLPTGFPSRRAWLHLLVKNSGGENIFESGKWDDEGEIEGLDAGFEPHHQIISSPDDVQIYQALMQDVDGKVTYTLLRGAQYAKDNRIPPRGFVSAASDYAAIAIVGEANADPDFNRDRQGIEGAGSDRVLYRIPVAEQGDAFTVQVTMYYQTLSPRFAQDLFAHRTDQVADFMNYYDRADRTPILVKSISLQAMRTGVKNRDDLQPGEFGLLQTYPNPFNASTVIEFTVEKNAYISLEIYNIKGEKIRTLVEGDYAPGTYRMTWSGSDQQNRQMPSGIYFATLRSIRENRVIRLTLLR